MNCARVETKQEQTYKCYFNEGGLSRCSLRI